MIWRMALGNGLNEEADVEALIPHHPIECRDSTAQNRSFDPLKSKFIYSFRINEVNLDGKQHLAQTSVTLTARSSWDSFFNLKYAILP